MTKLILDHFDREEWEIVVVFANTGKEREETFHFIRECDKHWGFNTVWVEAVINPAYRKGTRHKVVTYETASRKGEPFIDMIRKYGIPNCVFKHCTRELKINPIRSYAKNELGWKNFYTAIGIRVDEIERIKNYKPDNLLLYPLAHSSTMKATKIDVNRFWFMQPFRLQLESWEDNCDCCLEKGDNCLMTICKRLPHLTEWWIEVEDEFGDYIPPSRNQNTPVPIRFFRGNKSIRDFIEAAKKPFPEAVDKNLILH